MITLFGRGSLIVTLISVSGNLKFFRKQLKRYLRILEMKCVPDSGVLTSKFQYHTLVAFIGWLYLSPGCPDSSRCAWSWCSGEGSRWVCETLRPAQHGGEQCCWKFHFSHREALTKCIPNDCGHCAQWHRHCHTRVGEAIHWSKARLYLLHVSKSSVTITITFQ